MCSWVCWFGVQFDVRACLFENGYTYFLPLAHVTGVLALGYAILGVQIAGSEGKMEEKCER